MSTFIKVVSTTITDYIYSDINIDYGSEVATTVLNQDALTQKILLVLTTRYRSRKWRPFFGSKIHRELHQPFDTITAGWIGQAIKNALESPYNDLTEDVSKVTVTVIPDYTTSTYWTSINWVATKLQATVETIVTIDPSQV